MRVNVFMRQGVADTLEGLNPPGRIFTADGIEIKRSVGIELLRVFDDNLAAVRRIEFQPPRNIFAQIVELFAVDGADIFGNNPSDHLFGGIVEQRQFPVGPFRFHGTVEILFRKANIMEIVRQVQIVFFAVIDVVFDDLTFSRFNVGAALDFKRLAFPGFYPDGKGEAGHADIEGPFIQDAGLVEPAVSQLRGQKIFPVFEQSRYVVTAEIHSRIGKNIADGILRVLAV